jgi:peptidoglycan/LPS O-acetylase OafA/YrhL
MSITVPPGTGPSAEPGDTSTPASGPSTLFSDAPPSAPATHRPKKKVGLPYFAGLDGLRGLGLIFVLTYHAGYNANVPGAFLAVSMFFTLSGFLITSLILREREGTGTVDMRRFFLHRFRRLMPAAYAGLALVILFGFFVANETQLVNLRGDLLSAQFYIANWRFIASNQGYAELFNSPSPVLHFWSLAIEEQFYLLYPLVVIFCLKVLKMSTKAFGILVAALFCVSAALPHLFDMSTDRFYYGTDTRGAELLAGVLLAVVLSNRSLAEPGWSPATAVALRWVGMAAFVVTMAMWMLLPRDSGFVYNSGMALYGVVSALLVLGCVQPGALVGKILGIRLFRELGKISYGVYVYHWPIFIWLDAERTGLPTLPLFGLRLAITLAVSIASYYWLEMPIRRGQRPFGTANWKMAIGGAVAIVVAAFALGARAPEIVVAEETVSGPVDPSRVSVAGPFTPPPTTLPATTTTTVAGGEPLVPPVPKASRLPSRPLRVLYVGDSTAVSLAAVHTKWGKATDTFEVLNGATRGCGIVRGGQKMQIYQDKAVLVDNPEGCDWEPKWRAAITDFQPDLIVVSQSLWDTTDHVLEGDDTLRAPGDPVYDERLAAEYGALFDVLDTAGVPVAWLQQPVAKWGEGATYEGQPFEADDPARIERLNEIVATAGQPHQLFRVVPYDSFFENWPGGLHDPTLRIDGIHPTAAGGDIVMGWLGPELLWTYWDVWIEQGS